MTPAQESKIDQLLAAHAASSAKLDECLEETRDSSRATREHIVEDRGLFAAIRTDNAQLSTRLQDLEERAERAEAEELSAAKARVVELEGDTKTKAAEKKTNRRDLTRAVALLVIGAALSVAGGAAAHALGLSGAGGSAAVGHP